MDLLSAFYYFNVNGVDAISMDSVHVSVRIQRQTQDPLEIQKGEVFSITGQLPNSYQTFKAWVDYQNNIKQKIMLRKGNKQQTDTLPLRQTNHLNHYLTNQSANP